MDAKAGCILLDSKCRAKGRSEPARQPLRSDRYLGQAQERSRGREIGVSQRAFERAAERKEQTQQQAHGWSRGLSR